MKIISKFKDFYDYIVSDNDADITFVRNIQIVNDYFDDLFKKEGNYIPFFNKYYESMSLDSRRKNGELGFDNFIFGIYPFVFSQPILRIYYRHNQTKAIENKFIILGKELSDNILNKQTLDNNLISLAQNEFDKLSNNGICEKTKVHFASYNKLENIKKSLRSHIWKVECPEIFYKIESPVFVKYNKDLFVNGVYYENWPQVPIVGDLEYTHYVTNISFQKLNYNIIKYWYNDLNNVNTYNNIENFLWSVKQEPISNPDNKTKIVSHGFDLKTSFRNM